MTKEEFIIHQYSLHLSAFYSKNSADTIIQQGEHSRQAALGIATEDANFIERNHPDLFEHVQYTTQTIAGNRIKPATPPAVLAEASVSTSRADGGDSSQSFRDSITEVSRNILYPFIIFLDENSLVQSDENEKVDILLKCMKECCDEMPSSDPIRSLASTSRAGEIAIKALWILLILHHADDPISNIPDFSMAIMNRIVELLVKKNHDYGNSFGNQLAKHGPIVFKIRMEDKISRLRTLLTTDAQVKDESIEDTLRDIIGYCILFLHHTSLS